MAFDLSTARPVDEPKSGGFDLSTARPVEEAQRAPVAVDKPTAWQETKAVAGDLGEHAMNVLGELAAAANRSVVDFVDFIGPDTANAILRLSGSDKQMPTLRGAMADTGIEGGFMAPGTARDAVQAAGNAVVMAAGMVPVARGAGKAGSLVADFLGVGSTKAAEVPVSMARELALKRATGDVSTARHTLDAAGNVVPDQAAKKVIKQGFDEGFVAMIKASPPKAREKMTAMIDIVEQGKQNFRKGQEYRPLDIAGESVLNRVKVVREANRAAGNRLDHVAKSLKGQGVDVSPAVDGFLGDLENMGVKFSPSEGKVTFQGSDLEGVTGPQRVIKNVLQRMLNTKAPDAYDVHRMKRFIDEQVTYGKNARGLGGKTEGILKSLRHNLDGLLDEAFPAYNQVNTQYAETRGALDALQDVAGKKMDFTGENADKAIGTLTRRLLSNAQSRIPLKDAISELDTVARKFVDPDQAGKSVVPHGYITRRIGIKASDLDDDVLGQVIFVDELEKLLGASARTSFQGDIEKAVNTARGGVKNAIVDAGVAAANKARGINQDNALKAMRELLKEPK